MQPYTVHGVHADVVPPENEASYPIPDVIEEASLQDVTPHQEEHQRSFTVSYDVIQGGSKQGKNKLVDSYGYAYGQRKSRRKSSYMVLWECTTREKGMRCNATVIQNGAHFSRGPRVHCHPSEKGNGVQLKRQPQMACSNLHQP